MNTTQSIPDNSNAFYSRLMMREARPLLLHTNWGQVRDIPKNSDTKEIKFRKVEALLPATTPLVEGITPIANKLNFSTIYARIEQYGDYISLTDMYQMVAEDPVLSIAAEELGEQFGLTMDHLARDIINAGTNVFYANGAVSRAGVGVGDLITATDISDIVLLFANDKARKMTSMINHSSGVGSNPIPSCFLAIVHPNVGRTVKELAGFVPVEKYGSQQKAHEGEIGYLGEVRFLQTTEAKIFSGEGAGGIDVYSTLFLAKDAYGITRLGGMALENIVKALGSGGTSDPLNQRGTSGWKSTFTAKILRDENIARFESASEY